MTEVYEEKFPVWEGILNSIEEKEFEDCSDLEQTAILLANLNYQVENGGFSQWVDNGYGLKWRETIQSLRQVGTQNAMKVIDLIGTFSDYIKDDCEDRGCFGDYWIEEDNNDYYYGSGNDEDDDYEEEENPGFFYAREADHPYYEIYEELKKEIEEFFTNGGVVNENPCILEEHEKAEKSPRKPLVGPVDGNAFVILGAVHRALKNETNMSPQAIEEVINEAMSGDYNHLLCTCMQYVKFK